MKLPNGYGSITKLKGPRRKPWLVRITTGKDENGKQIRQTLGYYETRPKALEALTEFNRDPFDVTAAKLTFTDIYNQWKETDEYKNLSKSSITAYTSAYSKFSLIHSKEFIKIKISDLQRCIDNNTSGYVSNRKMKNLASKLYQLCILKEIVKENKAVLLSAGSSTATQKEKVPYSDDEIDVLWKHSDNEIVKMILIYIYTGVRCNELLDLKKENLHLDEQWFDVVQSKTKSGIRVVPIADVIVPLFQYFIGKSTNAWVFTTEQGARFTYSWWQKLQVATLKDLNMTHTTHEARHTCITQMTIHNVNPSVIKEIVGHKAAQSFTERVYTHIYLNTKIEAVNTIHTKIGE